MTQKLHSCNLFSLHGFFFKTLYLHKGCSRKQNRKQSPHQVSRWLSYVLCLKTGHQTHFWQYCQPTFKYTERGICSMDTHHCNVFGLICLGVPLQIWVHTAASWLCPSPSGLVSSSRQCLHAQELSQCLGCSTLYNTL